MIAVSDWEHTKSWAWAEVTRDGDYGGRSYGLAFAPDGRVATTGQGTRHGGLTPAAQSDGSFWWETGLTLKILPKVAHPVSVMAAQML